MSVIVLFCAYFDGYTANLGDLSWEWAEDNKDIPFFFVISEIIRIFAAEECNLRSVNYEDSNT